MTPCVKGSIPFSRSMSKWDEYLELDYKKSSKLIPFKIGQIRLFSFVDNRYKCSYVFEVTELYQDKSCYGKILACSDSRLHTIGEKIVIGRTSDVHKNSIIINNLPIKSISRLMLIEL